MCPKFTEPNGFPGRCAINTETSAVKHLRVRRQRWTDTAPSRAWQRCSFFYWQIAPQMGPICHPRAQRAASSGLTLGRVCGGVAVSVPLDGRTQIFQCGSAVSAVPKHTAVADKQCTGLQNPKMWARYCATRHAEWLRAEHCRSRGMAFTRRAIFQTRTRR